MAEPRRTWEYRVTQPMLPPGADSPDMDNRQMESWLNQMDAEGWEFVGFGQKTWEIGVVQAWWVFRRPAP